MSIDIGSIHRSPIEAFIDSDAGQHTLGLVYGRRRIGKSTLLEDITHSRQGFYWEATRTETAVQLARLGEALGAHLGVGALAVETWDDALSRLLQLGRDEATPVVLDEFGYVLEAEPAVASIVANALGPGARRSNPGRTRLILCGSAIAMMSSLTEGHAPLRGRAGLELVMQAHDYRLAARWLGPDLDLVLATRLYAVIGGVVGYATDMVDHDLPLDLSDFDRWINTRVLSPAATLHHEATTLLAEDPTLAATSAGFHHGILGAVASGSVTAGTIAKRLGRTVSNIDPPLKRLIAAGFVVRHADPIRSQRATYAIADPFLQFHYAVLEPHRRVLRDRPPDDAWANRLRATFDSRVRGPVFEEQTRQWVRRYASDETIGGPSDEIGPSTVAVDSTAREIDIVGASGANDTPPGERTVDLLGEAKSGEVIGTGRLTELERARSALGVRAARAKLLLFAPAFTTELSAIAARRPDVELVDLERLYDGE